MPPQPLSGATPIGSTTRERREGISKSLVLGIAGTLWLGAVAAGFAVLWAYKSTPAADNGRPPLVWPADSGIRRVPGRATLLMFAHPHCPCTHASVSELARLMSRTTAPMAAHVLVIRPAGVTADWDDTSLQRRAAAIPGASVTRDERGLEAARFRASTSGLVVLYAADGRRRFHGGITASRGHEGDSLGQRRLLSALNGERADPDHSPVFGCALGADHDSAGHSEEEEKEDRQ